MDDYSPVSYTHLDVYKRQNVNGTIAVYEAIKKVKELKKIDYNPMVVVACSSAEYGETLNQLEGSKIYVTETAE